MLTFFGDDFATAWRFHDQPGVVDIYAERFAVPGDTFIRHEFLYGGINADAERLPLKRVPRARSGVAAFMNRTLAELIYQLGQRSARISHAQTISGAAAMSISLRTCTAVLRGW